MRQIAALLLLTLCAVAPAFAQNTEKLPIVGVLRMNTPETAQLPVTGLKAALAALGRVDGRNIRLDVRLAGGHIERLPELAEALVREKASVILATGLPAILAAQRATRTIPIVADDDDLLAEGVIGSLANPGGNTTGISILATELDAKRLEILKQILPAARRIALLRDPSNSAPARVQPVAFLVLNTSPGNHQAWVAVSDLGDADFPRRLKKGAGADPTASGATRARSARL